jgi:transposase
MAATRKDQITAPRQVLYLAFELGGGRWKLAFTVGQGQAPRFRSMPAREVEVLEVEIAKAKRRFGLPADARVVSCYEAGRDGFWLHRYLVKQGVENSIVDSSSIEVNRRKRRAKSDGLDAAKLLSMLVRFHSGEVKVWSVVRVPEAAAEDQRQLHRELLDLKDQRTSLGNTLQGLLASQGLAVPMVDEHFVKHLEALRLWDGSAVPGEMQARLLRAWERWRFVDRQIKDLEAERKKRIRRSQTPHVDQVRRLLEMRGIGLNGAWLLVFELFA